MRTRASRGRSLVSECIWANVDTLPFICRSNPRRYSRHAIALQEDQKRALSLRARNRSGRSGPHDIEPEEVESMGSQATDEELSRRICGCFSTNSAAEEAFKDMMDLSLLKDGVFIMFAVSNFLTSIGFNAPYVYTVVSTSIQSADISVVIKSKRV